MPPPSGRHTSRGRVTEVARGLGALVGLLGVLVGVPLALWLMIGWPLPHAVPSPSELRDALTRPTIPDEFFPKALAVVAWLAWAQFVASLVAEAAASMRGTMPRRILGAGWGIQAAAARLVAAVLLLLPSPMLARPAAASTLPLHPAPVVRQLVTADPHGQAPTDPSDMATQPVDREPSAAHQPKRVVVQRHNTLWSLAQRHLGDPLRWHEIFELNKNRPLPDPPGGRFTHPDRIFPGQVLLMPADATGLPARQDRGGVAPTPGGTRPGGDGQARTAPPPAAATTAPATSVPATTAPAREPATTAPAREPATTAPATSVPATSVPATSVPATSVPAGERPGDEVTGDTAVPVASAVAIGGLLAIGVLATVARLRRRQQRYRRPGRRPRLPLGRAAHIEGQLRAAAEPEWARFLDAALRAMAAGLDQTGTVPPALQAVLLGPTQLEVLLEERTEAAPPPFTLGPDGRRWILPRHLPVTDLEAAAGDAVAPLPALVTLGLTDAGQLLINLEAPGLTALVGNPTATRPLLDAMAVEFATAASSGFVQVLLVGFGPELDRLERVQRVERLEDALPGLERQAQEAAALVDDRQVGSILGGRIAGDGADSWSPTVVLVAQPPSPASLERLATVTANSRHSTVAAVLVGDAPQAGWHLEVDDDHVRVPALELAVRPQRLTKDETAAIGALLDTAGDVKGVEPTAPPYNQLEPTATPAGPPGAVAELRAGKAAGARLAAVSLARPTTAEATASATVAVRVLGRVEVHGAGPRIERAKSIEAIVYLALHPKGVDPDRLWEALWPEKPLQRGTLHTTITTARTGLGRGPAPDRAPYFPAAREGLYRLSAAVGLDWAHFQVLAARGHDGGPDGIEVLRQALEMVRGMPLEAPTSRAYEWAVVHRTEMETVIAETAERLGLLYLDAGDPEQARWAARRGLSASPYDERLYRILMRAADAAGNTAGVEAVWQELLAVLGVDLELVDQDLHPETVALYASLRPAGRVRAGQARPQARRRAVSAN